MGEKVSLQIEIDASGAITAGGKLVRSLDEIRRAAGQTDKPLSRMEQMFGQFGARAAGYVTNLLSIAGAARLVQRAFAEFAESDRQLRLIESALRSLGNATDVTMASATEFADAYSKAFAFDDEAVLEAERTLLRFGVTTKEVMEEAIRISGDVARQLGVEIPQAAQMVGRALAEPGEGMRALKAAGLDLSDAAGRSAEALREMGRTADAQRVVLGSLRDEVGGTAAEMSDSLPAAMDRVRTAWGNLLAALGGGAGQVSSPLSGVASAIDILTTAVNGLYAAIDKIASLSGEGSRIGSSTLLLGPLGGLLALAGFVGGKGGGGAKAGGQNPLEAYFAGLTGKEAELEGLEAALAKINVKIGIEQKKALEDAAEAAKRHSDELARSVNALGSVRIETLQVATAQERLAKIPGVGELLSGPDLSLWQAFSRIQEASVSNIERYAQVQATVNAAVERRWITEAEGQSILRDQAVALGIVKETVDKTAKAFDAINQGFLESIGRGLHDSWVGFLREVESDLVDDLPEWLQPFASTLLDAANEWLVQMLSNIIKAKIAAKGIGSADGGSGSGMNWSQMSGWWSKIKGWFGGGAKGSAIGAESFEGSGGMFSGSGSGTAAGGSSWAGAAGGIAIAAITLGAILHNLNKAKQAEYGQKRETTASLSMEGGNLVASTTGRLGATGQAVANGLRDLFQQITSASKSSVTAMDSVAIDISNNKKYFDAKVGGILIGKFTSMEEAAVKAITYAFANAEGEIDAVLRSSMQHFTGKTADDAKKAAEIIGGVAAAFNELSEMDQTLMQIAPNARALTEELKALGVSALDASITGVRSMVVGFRSAWDALSGRELSPAEQEKRNERSRALLIARIKLEREELASDIRLLQLRGRVVQGNFNLNAAEIRGGTIFLQAQGKLWDAELDGAGGYLKARGQFVENELNLWSAELEAMQVVLKEMDALLAEVTTGEIRGLGGRRGGGRGGGSEWHNRLLAAVEQIRNFQKELVLGDLSPYGGQRKVEIARAEVDRLRELYGRGGRNATVAMEQLPDAIRQYLELFRTTYGTTGAYGSVFEEMNRFLSQILREHGVAPVATGPFGQDATANTDARAGYRNLSRMRVTTGGHLKTNDEEGVEEQRRAVAEMRRAANGIETLVGRGAAQPAGGSPDRGGGIGRQARRAS